MTSAVAALPMCDAVVTLTASRGSKLLLWDRLPLHSEHFCDVSLRSIDGQVFKAHRLMLSMASDPLYAMLSGSFAEGQSSEVPLESSSEALSAFLEFLYNGSARVKKTVIPELLRLVHQWEVQPLQGALTELLLEHMTPELCSSLIVDCEVLLVDELDEMLERYVLNNFAACVKTEQFGSWPLHRMIGLLRSDDLVVENEEEVLSAVMHWHRSARGRDDDTAALLQMVRFPLLSMASLQALRSKEGLTGLPGVVMARLAAAGIKSHQNYNCNAFSPSDSMCSTRSTDSASATSPSTSQQAVGRMPSRRTAFPYWWADFGCSIRGGVVVAERCQDGTEGELEPWAVHVHDGSLFIIDGREPCCVLQWPLGAPTGRVIVGSGSTLNGVNDFSDIIDIAIDSAGDLYVLDGQHGRIVRIHEGVGEVVGEGRLLLEGTRALYIGADSTIYFIDEGGSRVQRYSDGVTTAVAGADGEAGSGPGQLEDAEDIFVTKEGVLYISDSGNNRIQKWMPGATEGVTVAGGNGKGSKEDQLHHPVGLFVGEDGTIYVADYQNHRIMKWREGWSSGLVVAGGHGVDAGLHQLCEPIDVTMDTDGALYIADNGNARVVRWAAPCHPYEHILSSGF
jgi:sugar lactone lactonase YvrE